MPDPITETAIITDQGLTKIAAAATSGQAVSITHVALGDGGGAVYEPTFDQIALAGEQVRRPIDQHVQTDPNVWFIKCVFPEAETVLQTVREIGFFDADGDLIALVAGAGFVPREIGAFDYQLEHVLSFDRVSDGAVIVTAPNWDFLQHVVEDAAAHAALTDGQVRQQGEIDALQTALQHAVPIGAEMFWPGDTPPTGWLEEDGSTLSRAAYPELWAHAQASGMLDVAGGNPAGFGSGDGNTNFTLPDARGQFLRAWGHGGGVDGGRLLGSEQVDAIRSHEHFLEQATATAGNDLGGASEYPEPPNSGVRVVGGRTMTNIDAASETRPQNTARMLIIRAY